MPRQIQGSQTDFSFGEVDVALKRADNHPARKGGLRQMANARILNSGGFQNRSGRRALFPISNACSRIEKITMSAGNNFKIAFGAGRVQILDHTETIVGNFTLQGNGGALPWASAADINSIVYVAFNLTITICFGHAMRPQVLSWDGVSTWSIADYTEAVGGGGQKRTPFYRLSPQNVTMLPSAITGNITVSFSSPIAVAGMVGTRMRYCNRQILLTALVNSSVMDATVIEPLPPSMALTLSSSAGNFSIGDVIEGLSSGARGIITPPYVQLIPLAGGNAPFFVAGETIAGPAGTGVILSIAITAPQAVSVWDDEIINSFRGYPASCFTDQFRVGFCNFPALPGGICWSAINSPTDLYANDASSPDNSIFEIAPGKTQVYFVVPGPESSEFVFCDTKVYYIPISPTSPLVPGSVAFQLLSGDGAAQVQPRISQEAILYVNAGQNSMMAVIATGAYTRPFNTKNLSEFHGHLFSSIQAIAAPSADGTFNERYAYVLNANGAIVVGKYQPESLQTNLPVIGWGPWSGGAAVSWIAAWNADVIFTSSYFGAGICEVLDDSQYLDCALAVNAAPSPFTPPGGKGPLWFIAGQSVTLIDQVTRAMGTYQIDANGFIVPQFNGGENLAIASLVAGQPWTMTAEPFAPVAQSGGVDMHQRMTKRSIANFAVYAIDSTGFLLASLFSGKQTATSPALGTVMQERRVTTWNQGDDATKPPTLRETVEAWAPTGSTYDPRVAIIKDTPGPLLVPEIGMEISI